MRRNQNKDFTKGTEEAADELESDRSDAPLEDEAPGQILAEVLAQARINISSLAVRRLGLREHSRQELERWLKNRFRKSPVASEVKEIIVEVVAQLETDGRLSDDRYSKMMTRHQMMRGKGPTYIRMKLLEKGIRADVSQIRAWMNEGGASGAESLNAAGDADDAPEVSPEAAEIETARRVVERRYPDAKTDRKAAARAFQTLIRRGFSSSVARKALQFSAEKD